MTDLNPSTIRRKLDELRPNTAGSNFPTIEYLKRELDRSTEPIERDLLEHMLRNEFIEYGLWQDELMLLKSRVDENPQSTIAWIAYSECLLEQERVDEAIEISDRLLSTSKERRT